MYFSIKGVLVEKKPTLIIIENNGICYEIHISLETSKKLGKIEETINIFTYLYVKEDVFCLYGFYDLMEKELFLKLINVSGIGPKMALSLLSSAPVVQIISMIKNENMKGLCALPGIGKKTAGRLVLELRDPLAKLEEFSPLSKHSEFEMITSSHSFEMNKNEYEAVSALVSLGFSQQQAKQKVLKVLNEQTDLSLEDLIKKALK